MKLQYLSHNYCALMIFLFTFDGYYNSDLCSPY